MGNINTRLRGDDPRSPLFHREFQGELDLNQCVLVNIRNSDKYYRVNSEFKAFPIDLPLSEALCEYRIDPNQLKAAQLSGNLFKLACKNPHALQSLLDELAALPQLIRLRIVLPAAGRNVGRFLSILRSILKQVAPKEFELEDGLVFSLNEGGFDIKIRTEYISYDIDGEDVISGRAETDERLLNPLIEEVLQLKSLRECELENCAMLMGNTFQVIFNTSNLTSITLSGRSLGQFEISTLVNAINTLPSQHGHRRKRKRG